MKIFLVLGTLLLLSSTACTHSKEYYNSQKNKKQDRLNPRECLRYSKESQIKKCLRHVYEVNEGDVYEINKRLIHELDLLRMYKMDSMRSLRNGKGQGDLGLYRAKKKDTY
ncbi:MAG: hypothetical protein GY793_05990 [Proteobacteria bacterium]|nr:hypothetical protein [Pseudomonadota bacterium]